MILNFIGARTSVRSPLSALLLALGVAAGFIGYAGELKAQTSARPTTSAANFPSKTITLVVGFTAGGTTDVIARALAERLSLLWGQSVVVENKAGAGGNIAADLVAKAKPDGYTLLVGSVGPLAVNASLYRKMPYDNLRDFSPITMIAHVPNMLVVNPKAVAAKTVEEFVAFAKLHPQKLFYASTGNGTSSHLSGEMLNMYAGTQLTHVPYKGAVALTDVLAGESVQTMFATIPSAIQYVRAGKLHAIAVTSVKRSQSMPEVPTFAESGFPDFDASSWFALVGPAGMPRDIVLKIHDEVVRLLKDPVLRERFVSQGADPVGNTPEELLDYLRSETRKWAAIVKSSGARAD
jgi:tripartite-type tricarboxylate transporter receptor subunit TctC